MERCSKCGQVIPPKVKREFTPAMQEARRRGMEEARRIRAEQVRRNKEGKE